ncbi:MAG TPA: PTS sugar transporter subunit IIA [Candidatus Binatia bacterium]|nr:PTS sugar transporter subunit IIA [Candidatus Binatia bacterium]
MSFVARLRPELIRVAPAWRTFDETIAGLAGTLGAAGLLPPALEVEATRAVQARESEASTALLDIGVGVPHARLAGVARPLVALAVSPAGFYEAVPTVPIRIVALVLSPPDSGKEHLRILSGIATLLRSASLRTALVTARDGGEALASLRHHTRATPR